VDFQSLDSIKKSRIDITSRQRQPGGADPEAVVAGVDNSEASAALSQLVGEMRRLREEIDGLETDVEFRDQGRYRAVRR